jgi:hypothetical protein
MVLEGPDENFNINKASTMKEAWTQTQSLPTCTNCQKLENDKRLLRNELITIKER